MRFGLLIPAALLLIAGESIRTAHAQTAPVEIRFAAHSGDGLDCGGCSPPYIQPDELERTRVIFGGSTASAGYRQWCPAAGLTPQTQHWFHYGGAEIRVNGSTWTGWLAGYPPCGQPLNRAAIDAVLDWRWSGPEPDTLSVTWFNSLAPSAVPIRLQLQMRSDTGPVGEPRDGPDRVLRVVPACEGGIFVVDERCVNVWTIGPVTVTPDWTATVAMRPSTWAEQGYLLNPWGWPITLYEWSRVPGVREPLPFITVSLWPPGGSPIPPPLRADTDGNGVVNADDLFRYIDLWFLRDRGCNRVEPSSVDADDLLAYLVDWFEEVH
jgi:hypothetical protein